MTDQERARVVIWAVRDTAHAPEAVAAGLVAEFTTVRLEERRAIVAWLRSGYASRAAASIERGAHLEGR